ncbi:hypothetical protein GYMLUDRAFT_325658 [Collybiopsis luxurians FD-317 M1]|nr:hypothetical protein GYMLUDRAFT_325658 [Collybiopsis luxurians FD-317 M1]
MFRFRCEFLGDGQYSRCPGPKRLRGDKALVTCNSSSNVNAPNYFFSPLIFIIYMSQWHSSSSNLRDRSSLVPPGSTPPASGRSTPYAPSGHRYAEDLESQNDENLEGLSSKVRMLKDLTIGIGDEIKDSAIQLSQMNDVYAETSGILAGTFRRMNNMSARQGCRWLWYIVFLIVVFWFFVVVWWFRR